MHVERSIVVHVSPERVFPLVSDLRKFKEWNPWHARDPLTEYHFEGPASGTGAIMRWDSSDAEVGSGIQTIVESRPPEFVRSRLEFAGKGHASSSFVISTDPEGSMVTWSLDSNFDDKLFGRYFGLVLEYLIGKDYETGLANLKRIAEAES